MAEGATFTSWREAGQVCGDQRFCAERPERLEHLDHLLVPSVDEAMVGIKLKGIPLVSVTLLDEIARPARATGLLIWNIDHFDRCAAEGERVNREFSGGIRAPS
ncbi:hypothetical protein BpKM390_37720 [Burkholderia pseudomallei]|nr:hypothetical protein TKS_36430 [Burkholderia pseudomallei]BEH62527.1 hypothetical protein BpKM390_37720 [Burkholderia pseudomallei]